MNEKITKLVAMVMRHEQCSMAEAFEIIQKLVEDQYCESID